MKAIRGIIVAGFVLVLGHGCTKPPRLHELISSDGKFTVRMPGPPRYEEHETRAGKNKVYRFSNKNEESLLVSYTEQVDADDTSRPTNEQLIEAFLGKFVLRDDRKLVYQKNIKLAGTYPGCEVLAENTDHGTVFRGRLYFIDGRIYQVFATGSSTWINSQDTKEFFDSFTVTK